MEADPEPTSLTPKSLAALIAGLLILTALSYYRLSSDSAKKTETSSSNNLLRTYSGATMGTTYTVRIMKKNADDFPNFIMYLMIAAALNNVNLQMSTYDANSELSSFNKADFTGRYWMSKESIEVFDAALRVHKETNGAFDITVGPIVNAYGFGPDMPGAIPTDSELAELRRRIGSEKLTVDTDSLTIQKSQGDLYCDLSAIAKGFAVDAVAQAVSAFKGESYFIEIGGEIRARGTNAQGKTWTVGIEKPLENERAVQRIIELDDLAMATSGDYRNYFEDNGQRISHTIDPRTGRPIDHNLASVSVFHKQCMLADAYATGLMVLGPEEGFQLAQSLNLAALFTVREADGTFTERATPAYEQLFGPLNSQKP